MNMEFNKIFGALLTAGIIASFAGFMASHVLYHPRLPAEHAYKVEVAEDTGTGVASAAPAVAEPIDELLKTADAAKGQKLSSVCASCHTFDAGGANKIGPNLHGIIGAKHAHNGSFAYSDAMKAKNGEKWDYDALNRFLWSPKKTVPGTKMTFAGMKKAEDRANLIKWLETQK